MAFLMKNTLKLTPRCFLISTTKNAEYLSMSTSAVLWQKQNTDNTETQKKSKESIKITLIQNNHNVTVTALEEARNLAKRRSMHLVQMQKMDNKTQRPVYKLLTSAERLQQELSELKSQDKSSSTGAQKKSEKTLNIGSRISDHDLLSRLKNIAKWLEKRHEVRILIQGSDNDGVSCEKIFKAIDESIKSPETIGKIVQKRTKGSAIKFNIIPVDDASDNAAASTKL